MDRKKRFVIFIARLCGGLVGTIIFSSVAVAQEMDWSSGNNRVLGLFPHVDGGVSLGVIGGEASEYVFDPSSGATLSKLHWNFSNDLSIDAHLGIQPLSWLTASADGQFGLTHSSHNTDTDYGVFGCPSNECYSSSPASLQDASRYDFNLGAVLFRSYLVKLLVIGGYRSDHFQWLASGGTSNYDGPLPSGPGINYSQSWQAPYLGLGAQMGWNRWDFGGRFIGSGWAQAKDRDLHYQAPCSTATSGACLYQDSYGSSTMYGVDLNVAYRFISSVSLIAGYSWQQNGLAKGSTKTTDLSTGATNSYSGDVAGASALTNTLSIGLKGDF